jgi:hypothetical protein
VRPTPSVARASATAADDARLARRTAFRRTTSATTRTTAAAAFARRPTVKRSPVRIRACVASRRAAA